MCATAAKNEFVIARSLDSRTKAANTALVNVRICIKETWTSRLKRHLNISVGDRMF